MQRYPIFEKKELDKLKFKNSSIVCLCIGYGVGLNKIAEG